MTGQELQEIEDRWAKATPGPWESHYCEYDDGEQGPQWTGEMEVWQKGADRSRRSDVLNIALATVGYHGSGENDAAAIASAPTDIADLLAEVRRLRGENLKMRNCHNCGNYDMKHDNDGDWVQRCKYNDMEHDDCGNLSEWEAAGNG